MDPVSISAASVAFIGAAGSIVKLCQGFRSASADITRVARVVEICRTAVQVTANAVEQVRVTNAAQSTIREVRVLIEQSLGRVVQLEHLLNSMLLSPDVEGIPRVQQRLRWPRCKSKVEALLKDLNDDREMLGLMLPALLLHTTTNVQSRMSELTTLTTQVSLLNSRQTRTSLNPDATISNFDQSQTCLATAPGNVRASAPLPQKSTCRAACPCRCHRLIVYSNGAVAAYFFGLLRISITGAWLSGCNEPICERDDRAPLTMEYQFPAQVWSRMISLLLQFGSERSVPAILRVSRVISEDDLYECAFYIFFDAFDGLLEQYSRGLASPGDITSDGTSLLSMAVQMERWDFASRLLHCNPPIEGVQNLNSLPLQQAALELLYAYQRLPSLSNWQQKGFTVVKQIAHDVEEDVAFTRLHRCILGITNARLEHLLELDTRDIDIPDSCGRTALDWAVITNNLDAINLLLDFGADVMAGADDYNFLHKLMQYHVNDEKLLQRALENECDIESRNSELQPPLIVAALFSNVQGVELLLRKGADPNEQDSNDSTALVRAITREDNSALTRLLLEYGADDRLADDDGHVPLTIAIWCDRSDCTDVLLLHRPIREVYLVDQDEILNAVTWASGPATVLALLQQCWAEAADVEVFSYHDLDMPFQALAPSRVLGNRLSGLEYKLKATKPLLDRLRKKVQGCRNVSARSGRPAQGPYCEFCIANPITSEGTWQSYPNGDEPEHYLEIFSTVRELRDDEDEDDDDEHEEFFDAE